MSFEENVQRNFFQGNREKTYIDKVLARQDVEALRALVKKPKLTREDMLEILYLIGSTEAKLLNYDEWDRYVILKFFVWVREFTKVAEILFDYEEDVKKNLTLSPRGDKLFSNCRRLIEHNVKFLVDLYLNIARTTLSVHAAGLLELTRNKFEFAYPSAPMDTQSQGDQARIVKVKA